MIIIKRYYLFIYLINCHGSNHARNHIMYHTLQEAPYFYICHYVTILLIIGVAVTLLPEFEKGLKVFQLVFLEVISKFGC